MWQAFGKLIYETVQAAQCNYQNKLCELATPSVMCECHEARCFLGLNLEEHLIMFTSLPLHCVSIR